MARCRRQVAAELLGGGAVPRTPNSLGKADAARQHPRAALRTLSPLYDWGSKVALSSRVRPEPQKHDSKPCRNAGRRRARRGARERLPRWRII